MCRREFRDELGEFGSGGCTHPRTGAVNVAFYGPYRQGEGFSNLYVGQALRDQNRDLTFAVGQWQRHGRGLGGRGGGPAAGGQSAGTAAGGQCRAALRIRSPVRPK
jgi:hypothetical protein